MKIGDLVRWRHDPRAPLPQEHMGLIVDGPRAGVQGTAPSIAYQVAWLQVEQVGGENRAWHNDHNLELISESR